MSYRDDAHDDRSLLLVAADSELVAFRRADGVVAWRQSFPITFLGIPAKIGGAVEIAIHQGRVYVGLRDRIVCLEYQTGAIVGQITLPRMVHRASFLLDGDHLYVASADAILCLTHNGKTVWESPHGLSLRIGPALAMPGNVRQADEIGPG
jgi:outer membrane protein assembly factor BamB